MIEVVAPGKLFLCGEYAVLEGAPALVAAVSPMATARWVEDAPFLGGNDLPSCVATQLARRLGTSLPPGAPVVDTAAFLRPNGQTRGLGSSAAAAAAAAGATAEALGFPIEAGEVRPFLLAASMAGHSEHQGGVGSGADVAAAIQGGVIGFSRDRGPQSLDGPEGLSWAAVEVGPGGASTPDLIRALSDQDPASVGPAMADLANAAGEAVRAWVSGRTTRFLQWIEAYRDGLARLGEVIDRPIVTPRDLQVADVARRHGGAAKPSGAGGGELAVVFAPSGAALEAILADCEKMGAQPAPGVHPEQAGLRLSRPSTSA